MKTRRAAVTAVLSAALVAGCGAPTVRPEPPVDPLDGHPTEPDGSPTPDG